MKKIMVIKLEGDPYCVQIHDVLERLSGEYPSVDIEIVDEKIQPEIVKNFANAYEHVPCIFVDGKKVYESHPGESFEECFESVKKVFQSVAE